MDIIDLHDLKKKESSGSPSCAIHLPGSGLSVALGSFDGVHLGHAALINRAVENARENHRASAVWTFSDDPAVIPGKYGMKSLTTLDEKLGLIASLGVDYAVLARFEDVRDLSPEEFIGMLRNDCCAKAVVCGFNYSFGKRGAGKPDKLRESFGENCFVVDPVCVDGEVVSSSAIRSLLEAGDAEGASRLLGHDFFINFPVVHGKELGRTIGLPTINQNFPDGILIPKEGIYAGRVEIAGREYVGVSNVGTRPTVDDSGRVNCETHIIGFDGWLYDERVKVGLAKRLRGEIKFPDIESLREQIERDARAAEEYFRKTK